MPDWAEALAPYADEHTSRRLIAQLTAVEVAALAFCRLLESWARGEVKPWRVALLQRLLAESERRARTWS